MGTVTTIPFFTKSIATQRLPAQHPLPKSRASANSIKYADLRRIVQKCPPAMVSAGRGEPWRTIDFDQRSFN
jgi:hypothetical protein